MFVLKIILFIAALLFFFIGIAFFSSSDEEIGTPFIILGAAALGDIGLHFPDSNPAYEGADSLELLKRVGELLSEAGYRPVNIDATVLCQRPKLRPYIDKMRANIAGALCMKPSAVSVKATTEEGLGFTGHMEGIAAHAVCLIEEK